MPAVAKILSAMLLACTGVLSGSVFAVEPAKNSNRSSGQKIADIKSFLRTNCFDCHEGSSAEGGLDLVDLSSRVGTTADLDQWVDVYDRVHEGEMPPDASDLEDADRNRFLTDTKGWVSYRQRSSHQQHGRVRGRRLTNLQLERTLHDLLGIDIPLASRLPEEPRSDGFTSVADGQAMSHFQLHGHLEIVDLALDEAFRRSLSAPDEKTQVLKVKDLVRRRPNLRVREPELYKGKAVTWSGTITYYGRLPATRAPEDGWYRFKIRHSALNVPDEHGVWCSIRRGLCVSSAPMLPWVGAFEAGKDERERTVETWLPKGHMLEIRPGDATIKRARFQGGQVGSGEGQPQKVPGLAISEVTMQRFHRGPDDSGVRRLLFDDLQVTSKNNRDYLISSSRREMDAERLIQRFAEQAFRRPVNSEVTAPYVAVAHDLLDQEKPMHEALRAAYRAILCSPRFLYFYETPGKLDSYAVASRMSYLIWNSKPNERLSKVAKEEDLTDPKVLRAQIGWMLSDPRGENFIKDFAAEWLDLRLIDFTEPDRQFKEFDVIVQNSMLAETHTFLQTMLDENLSISHLIDSDFTFLNNRLARYYDIDGVKGDHLRRVSLKPEHRRGGLITQGAILKVTANGSATSPVVRGIWMCERVLGIHIPPPPDNIPAIEPDIRGAKTIREILEKHRSVDSCASCHKKLDPPGFALENYDPAGQWRDRYTATRGKKGASLKIDASYKLADGRHFKGIEDFRRLMSNEKEPIARNLVEKLITYGTGAPPTFADRGTIAYVVESTRNKNYGFRSLLSAAITSSVFRTK